MNTVLHGYFFFGNEAPHNLFESELHIFTLSVFPFRMNDESRGCCIELCISSLNSFRLSIIILPQALNQTRLIPNTTSIFKMIENKWSLLSLRELGHPSINPFVLTWFIPVAWTPNEMTFVYDMIINFSCANSFWHIFNRISLWFRPDPSMHIFIALF